MAHQLGTFVLPGDEIVKLSEFSKNSKIILGPGVRQQKNGKIFACKAGILRQKSTNLIFVDSLQKRYVPCRGETIIGNVIQKTGEVFRVDIGANEPAALPYLSFEGATKKNRPDVSVGDLVFAKLLIANKDFESELICIDSTGKQQKLGILRDGFVLNCGINLARKLRNDNYPLMELIQRHMPIPLEMVTGLNGRIWINTKREGHAIAIGNTIMAAQYKKKHELEALCIHMRILLAETS